MIVHLTWLLLKERTSAFATQAMKLIQLVSKEDSYDGVIIDAEALPTESAEFETALVASLQVPFRLLGSSGISACRHARALVLFTGAVISQLQALHHDTGTSSVVQKGCMTAVPTVATHFISHKITLVNPSNQQQFMSTCT